MERREKDADVTRRDFVKQAGTMVSGAAAAGALHWARAARGAEASSKDTVTVPSSVLGRTGQRVSKLGIGCAHFQRKEITPADVHKVLQRAVDLGVTYLDVAPNYGRPDRGYAEEKMGPAIKELRDKFFLVTKTEDTTYKGTWRLLRQSMKRMQTDHLDMVHLHNVGMTSWFPDIKRLFSDDGAMGALREAKQKGVIRFIGASGHLHPSAFHAVLDSGEIDVLMNAVNFIVQHVYAFERRVWTRARAEGLGLVAMKVLGGAGPGQRGFRIPPEQYANAVRYVLSIPGLSVAVMGLATVSELEQAARTVAEAKPLSRDESYQLSKLGLELAGTSAWSAAYGLPIL